MSNIEKTTTFQKLDINFLGDREPTTNVICDADTQKFIGKTAISTVSSDRGKIQVTIENNYKICAHPVPKIIECVRSPNAAFELLSEHFPPNPNPIQHNRFTEEWSKRLPLHLSVTTLNQMSQSEKVDIYKQLCEQMAYAGLFTLIERSLRAPNKKLGYLIDLPFEEALLKDVQDKLDQTWHSVDISKVQKQVFNDPFKTFINTLFPAEISLPCNLKRDLQRVLFSTKAVDQHIEEEFLDYLCSFIKEKSRYPFTFIRPEKLLSESLYLIELYHRFNLMEGNHLLEVFKDFVSNCGWVIAFENVCIVCDRPIKVDFDEDGELHGEIVFSDGYTIVANHGLLSHTFNSQDRAKICFREEEASLSSLIREIAWGIGSKTGYRTLQATVVDVFESNELLSITINDESINILKITTSSGGETIYRIPLEVTDIQTAIKWINFEVR